MMESSRIMRHDKCLYHNKRSKMFFLSEKLVDLLRNPEAVSFVKDQSLWITSENKYDSWYYLNRKGHEKRYNFRSWMLTDIFQQAPDRVYYLIGEKRIIAGQVYYKLVPELVIL